MKRKARDRNLTSRTKTGFFLWLLVLLGYFLFVVNWTILGKLEGSVATGTGWISSFFSTHPSEVTTQAVNYTITAMRGVGSVLAGWVIAKVGHKYAVVIALVLLSFALPTVFFPKYWLFIVGRMVMAVGGTVLIVYTQPIISNFFKNNKTRGLLNIINPLGFNLGTALPLIPFMIPHVATAMIANWQLVAGLLGGFPIIILALYIIFGVQFEVNVASDSNDNINKRITMWSVLKERNTWKMICYYGPWLIAVVLPLLLLSPTYVGKMIGGGANWSAWEKNLPPVLFLLGLIPGIFLIGRITKTNIDRRAYIAICSGGGILAMLLGYISQIYVTGTSGVALTCLFWGISGTFLWGIQGVFLYVPHEFKGNTPRKIGLLFGWTWGVGYLFYTLGNILAAAIEDIMGTNGGALWIQIVIYIVVCLPMFIVPLFLPKTQNGKLIKIFRFVKK